MKTSQGYKRTFQALFERESDVIMQQVYQQELAEMLQIAEYGY